MSQEKYKQQIRKQIETALRKEIKDAPTTIKRMIEGALLSLVGLENRCGGKYEIDHCNGRSSVLTKAFEEIARDEARKIAMSYKPTDKELVAFRGAFEKEYNSQMNYRIREMATERAKTEAAQFVNSIKVDIDAIFNTPPEKPQPEF